MDNIINEMLKKADETARDFTDGLPKEDLQESLDNSYQEIAADVGLSPEKSDMLVKFLTKKFGVEGASPEYVREWAQRFQSNTAWERADSKSREILKELGFKPKDEEASEGIIPDDKDSEEEKIKKLTEEETEDEEIPEEEIEDESEEADEEKEIGSEEKAEVEIKKEYVGKKGDNFYYLTQVAGEGDQIEDLLLSDQEGNEVFSAIKAEIDPVDLTQFVIDACRELEIEDISFDLFSRYILPKLLDEEEPEEEEEEGMEEEMPSEEEFEDFMADEEPIEAEVKHNGNKIFGTISKNKSNESVSYPTKIGEKEYIFSKSFVSRYVTEGKLTEEGFKKLAIDVLDYEN